MGYYFDFHLTFFLQQEMPESAPVYKLKCSDSSFVSVEENPNTLHILLGIMHKEDRASLAKLSERLAEKEETWAKLRGRYCFFVLNKATRSLKVYNDYFGTFPVFTRKIADTLSFTNRPNSLVAGTKWQLDREALYFFLDYGVTPNPRTLVEGLSLVRGVQLYEHFPWQEPQQLRSISIPKIEALSFSDSCILLKSSLKKSIETLFTYTKIDELRLSGGADTRLTIIGYCNRYYGPSFH